MKTAEIIENICRPRFIGTDGHTLTKEYIINFMRRLDYNVESEVFFVRNRFTEILRYVLIITAVVLVAVLVITYYNMILAITILIAFPVMIILGLRSTTIIKHVAFGDETHGIECSNIICRKGRGKRVILCAHYDTKSQFFSLWARVALFIILALAYIFAIVFGILSIFSIDVMGLRPHDAVKYPMTLGIIISLVLAMDRFGNATPGAYDNGIGVAALLMLAEKLSKGPIDGMETVFLFTDAEEVGLLGAIHFATEHNMKDCVVINMDIPFDRKGIVYLNTGTLVPPMTTSKQLNNIIIKTAQRKGIKIKKVFVPIGAMADHIVLGRYADMCAAFLGHAPKVHTPWDSKDYVNHETIERFVDLLYSCMEGIATL